MICIYGFLRWTVVSICWCSTRLGVSLWRGWVRCPEGRHSARQLDFKQKTDAYSYSTIANQLTAKMNCLGTWMLYPQEILLSRWISHVLKIDYVWVCYFIFWGLVVVIFRNFAYGGSCSFYLTKNNVFYLVLLLILISYFSCLCYISILILIQSSSLGPIL